MGVAAERPNLNTAVELVTPISDCSAQKNKFLKSITQLNRIFLFFKISHEKTKVKYHNELNKLHRIK